MLYTHELLNEVLSVERQLKDKGTPCSTVNGHHRIANDSFVVEHSEFITQDVVGLENYALGSYVSFGWDKRYPGINSAFLHSLYLVEILGQSDTRYCELRTRKVRSGYELSWKHVENIVPVFPKNNGDWEDSLVEFIRRLYKCDVDDIVGIRELEFLWSYVFEEASFTENLAVQMEAANNGDVEGVHFPSLEFYRQLNVLKGYNAFFDYIIYSCNSVYDFITNHKMAIECEYCRRLLRFREGKKYCSLKSDGRDCGKKARNRRDYMRHGLRRRKNSKHERRLDRELLRRIRKREDDSDKRPTE